MGSFSIWHWLIVLAVVMLIFGTGKLRSLGSDLGGAVRGFKDGMNEAAAGRETEAASAAPDTQARRIDAPSGAASEPAPRR